MLQKFDLEEHKKFIKKLKIKEKPSEIEEEFYKKVKKYLVFIKWIPWLKMVAVGNSISMNCSTKNSDIDLFIVTSPKKMWFVRIVITIIFQILWVRKTPKKHAGRFCLSFFSTTDWMNFWNFALEKDIYLYFWIIYFKPILDFDNTYEKFLEKNSSWADFWEYKDFFEENRKYIKYWNTWFSENTLEKGKKIRKEKSIFDNLWNFLDKILKKIFLKKTLKNFEKLWKPYGIIINDNMLKFHNNDVRKEFLEK